MIKCIRGAITVENNDRDEMLEATAEMLSDIIKKNGIGIEQIISVNFTATRDLDAVYPAVAARKMGICDAALMCAQEMYVKGSLEKCIRADVMVEISEPKRLRHSYLRGAVKLRPDLIQAEAVAIDGPAGSGKSTVARAIARELGYIYVDTGAMYRAVGLYCLKNGIDAKNAEAVACALDKIEIRLENSADEQKIFLGTEDVTAAVRTQEVAEAASDVAVIPEVRKKLVDIQKRIAAENKVVMDGRDIGTNVIPNARVKVYLDASVEARTSRRCSELEKSGKSFDEAKIKQEIIERDRQDKGRKTNPLTRAEDAHYIDSSEMSADEVREKIVELVRG